MKRFAAIILILSFVFALASCGKPAEEPATQQPTGERETTAEAQTSEPETEPEKPFFQLTSLPDIGEHKSKSVIGRWYDSYQDHLIPRKDYGTLVPFVGEVKDMESAYAYTDDGEPELETATNYGLMTTDGKIVVDAAYNYVWMETAPNGEAFYHLSGYARTNVPASQVDPEDPSLEDNKSYLIDSKGSKLLEIPYGFYSVFTKNNLVVIPDFYGPGGTGRDSDSIKVYDMSFNCISTLSCKALANRDIEHDNGGFSTIDCGCLCYRGDSGCLLFDLNGKRLMRDKIFLSNAWGFGDYIILELSGETQKLVDISGKEYFPNVRKGISTVSVMENSSDGETLLCVEQNGSYQCYNSGLQPVGSVVSEWPCLVKLFGKVYYRSNRSGGGNLSYRELETNKPLDWSKYTKLNMSTFEQDYKDEYARPCVIGDRCFVHVYSRNVDNDYAWHNDVIDLQSGETIAKASDAECSVFGNRWLLLKSYADKKDIVLDTQTQSVLLSEDNIRVYEVDGVSYCLWMRNGYSFVKNLNTQETLLSMFIASAI